MCGGAQNCKLHITSDMLTYCRMCTGIVTSSYGVKVKDIGSKSKSKLSFSKCTAHCWMIIIMTMIMTWLFAYTVSSVCLALVHDITE